LRAVRERPRNYFEVAKKLEQWGLLDEARKYAEQGVETAGADLLVDPANQSGAVVYARIMATAAPDAMRRLRVWQLLANRRKRFHS
jgi:hypothetical protein